MGSTPADELSNEEQRVEDEELLGGQEVVKGPRLLPSITNDED